MSDMTPLVSIIIPSLNESRKRLLDSLLKDIETQTFQDFEILVIRGDARQGRAINRGARMAQGNILLIFDDDSRLADEYVVERVVRCVQEDASIGMAGASTLIPDWASPLQKRAMAMLPRRFFPLVDQTMDSDMAQHPCCAIRKDVFWEVGGEREDIIRGLDPDLRHRIRQAGYRVVIAPRCGIYHMLPDSYGGLMRMAFRNGMGSAFAQKKYPEWIVQTGDGVDEGFERWVPFRTRLARYPRRVAKTLLSGNLLLFSWLIMYAVGHACCSIWWWRRLETQSRWEVQAGNDSSRGQ